MPALSDREVSAFQVEKLRLRVESVKKPTGLPDPNSVRGAEPPSRFPWRKGRLSPVATAGEDRERQASADREGGSGVHWLQAPSEVSLSDPGGA